MVWYHQFYLQPFLGGFGRNTLFFGFCGCHSYLGIAIALYISRHKFWVGIALLSSPLLVPWVLRPFGAELQTRNSGQRHDLHRMVI
jgi:hypothetical protein